MPIFLRFVLFSFFLCFAQREALLEGGKPVSNITIPAKVIAAVPTKKGIAENRVG